MKGIAVLGCTGSIGRQTLQVIRSFPQEFHVVGLAGWSNLALLEEQVREFQPPLVSCCGSHNGWLPPDLAGHRGVSLEEMASSPEVDLVVVAISGPASLLPTLRALEARKRVALASKEVLVMAGKLVTREARKNGSDHLLPVDSEPSAIWQCLQGEDGEIARLILTASGGPFRASTPQELAAVTPQQALRHPTWRMGKKITVDSATLMNKAFEVIESAWLFGVPWEAIHVVIHPQSMIHSMVEFRDGSVKAQLSTPDMRLPIQYALFYPRRPASPFAGRLDISRLGALTFELLEPERFPCFSLGLEAARAGDTYPAVVSAADEVAVELFLQEELPFTEIASLVSRVIQEHRPGSATSLEAIFQASSWARRRAQELATQEQ